MSTSPIIPGNLPGLPEAWRDFHGFRAATLDAGAMFDLRIPADRCLVAYWMARVLGVPVGATVPAFEFLPGLTVPAVLHSHFRCERREPIEVEFWVRPFSRPFRAVLRFFIPSLSSIPLDSPDRDALALAACAIWLADELRAGRITPAPLPAVPAGDPPGSVAALPSEVK